MAEVFKIMENAKQAILFLVSNPRLPSIVEKVIQCQQKNPKLYIKGAKSDAPATKAEAVAAQTNLPIYDNLCL